jgi:hypothetical protein
LDPAAVRARLGRAAVATIQRAVLEEADLSIFAAEGELRLEEIVDELLDQLAERPTRLVLWDLSAADLSRAANAAIVDLAWHIKGPVIRMHGGRMAMVCPRNSEFDVARMFRDAAARLRVPLKVGVFRAREDAASWLDVALPAAAAPCAGAR